MERILFAGKTVISIVLIYKPNNDVKTFFRVQSLYSNLISFLNEKTLDFPNERISDVI